MKWITIGLLLAATVLFAVGKWTRVVGRSADERAGSDIPYLLGGVLLAIDILLLAGWAVVYLIFH